VKTRVGAYVRTALGNLGYAALILKIFSAEFAKIGLLYTIVAMLLLIISVMRRKRSDDDFEDSNQPSSSTSNDSSNRRRRVVSTTTIVEGERIFGRSFRTSGDIVVILGLILVSLNIAALVLVLTLS
jgi:hypothetical protein